MLERTAVLGTLIAAAATVGAAADSQARTPSAAKPASAWDLCAAAVRRTEAQYRIPKKLMRAISLVESGRWNAERRQSAAWPWTVYAEGRGRVLPTKQAAVAAVRSLQARGVRNIDVGCMQVNLYYHPDAFPSLDDAFDPLQNADYAARFLTDLKRAHGSWRRAVQHYHSATPERRVPYQKRVYALWRGSKPSAGSAALSRGKHRLRRVARKVNRAHRAKLAAHRPQLRKNGRTSAKPGARSKPGATTSRKSRVYGAWPRRGVKAQRRAENIARVRAFTPAP